MAKRALAKNWRVNRHILGVTVCFLFATTIVLMAILCFWLFFSPPEGTENGGILLKLQKVVTEETPPEQEVLLGEPVASWTEEEDGLGEGDAIEEEIVDPYTYTDLDMTLYAQTSLRVRDQPSLDGSRIGGLYRNQKVKATGVCNETGWFRIDYYGCIGYA
ncbi:MAG: SH3 domain-containing protein, partial [Acetatifactor sp.]|nr:SH3 domain-containing protein [Acetatifactor sp.]